MHNLRSYRRDIIASLAPEYEGSDTYWNATNTVLFGVRRLILVRQNPIYL